MSPSAVAMSAQRQSRIPTCSRHSSAADAPRKAGCAAATREACCDSSAPPATSRDAARSIASDSSHGRHEDEPDLPRCSCLQNPLRTDGQRRCRRI